MRTQLAEKILPYWYDTAQDTNRGGYLLADDALRGRRRPVEKQLVTQSRMVWGFSRAHLAGFSDTNRNYLAAATQGYHFLLDHFLDRRNGGYYWSTDLGGNRSTPANFSMANRLWSMPWSNIIGPATTRKHCVGRWNCIRPSRRICTTTPTAAGSSTRSATWKLLAPGDPRDPVEVIGYKSANAHLHWMEALTELYDASHDPAVKESLNEALAPGR